MSARTLFVGLDAADPFLLERWSVEGALPRFASFSRDAARFDLANSLAVIGGGVWQELNSGRSCGHAGIYFPARQLHTGDTSPRPVEVHEVDPRAYWTIASDAGRRVAVVDIPHSVPPPSLNGIFVTEWGTHDRLYGQRSLPEGLFAELSNRYGDYPLWSRPWPRVTTAGCDGHDGSPEQLEQLLDDLQAGIERKTRLLLDVMGRDEWDLFACAFSEGQCSGHQLWHVLRGVGGDHTHFAGRFMDVYKHLDIALGGLVDAAGPGATVFVVSSHAFVDPTGGRQLIPEVLLRLGYGSGGGSTARARAKVPPFARALLRRVLPSGARAMVQTRVGALPNPLDSSSTRAVALDGDRCSWIRLNLIGREPSGSVEPGDEADSVLADIRSELLLLEDPDSGQRIVTSVQSAEEAFGAEHHPDVPDLIVNFRDDLGELDACRSSRVGLVRVPLRPTVRRTGAHPPVPSRLWIAGPGIPKPSAPGEGKAVDLAPTIIAQLGLPPPHWLEGEPLL